MAARKDLQDILGAHQDRQVSAAFPATPGPALASAFGPATGFTYGLLYARVVAAGDTLVADLRPIHLPPAPLRMRTHVCRLKTADECSGSFTSTR